MIATMIPTTPNWDCRCDVARYTKDGLRVATNIFEAAAWHKGIRPVCKCGHSAVFNPHGLWWRFECKGWDDQLVKAANAFGVSAALGGLPNAFGRSASNSFS